MQHAFDTDALIDLRPIDTGAVTDQLPMVALSRSGLSVVTGIDGLIFTFRDGESCLPTVTFSQTLALLVNRRSIARSLVKILRSR